MVYCIFCRSKTNQINLKINSYTVIIENIYYAHHPCAERAEALIVKKFRKGSSIKAIVDNLNEIFPETNRGAMTKILLDKFEEEKPMTNPETKDADHYLADELKASQEYLDMSEAVKEKYPIEAKVLLQQSRDELRHYKFDKHLKERGIISNPLMDVLMSPNKTSLCFKKVRDYDRELLMDNITGEIVNKIPIFGDVASLRNTLGISKGSGVPKCAFIYASKDREIVRPMDNTLFFFVEKQNIVENTIENITDVWSKHAEEYVDEMLKASFPKAHMVTPSVELKFEHKKLMWDKVPTDVQTDFIIWSGYKGYRTQKEGNAENPVDIPKRFRYYTTKTGRYIWADLLPKEDFVKGAFRIKKILKGKKVVMRLLMGRLKRTNKWKVQAELLEKTPENELKARIKMTSQYIDIYKHYAKKYSEGYALRKAWKEFERKYSVKPLIENGRYRYYLKPLSEEELDRYKKFDNLWGGVARYDHYNYNSGIQVAKEVWDELSPSEKEKYKRMAKKAISIVATVNPVTAQSWLWDGMGEQRRYEVLKSVTSSILEESEIRRLSRSSSWRSLPSEVRDRIATRLPKGPIPYQNTISRRKMSSKELVEELEDIKLSMDTPEENLFKELYQAGKGVEKKTGVPMSGASIIGKVAGEDVERELVGKALETVGEKLNPLPHKKFWNEMTEKQRYKWLMQFNAMVFQEQAEKWSKYDWEEFEPEQYNEIVMMRNLIYKWDKMSEYEHGDILKYTQLSKKDTEKYMNKWWHELPLRIRVNLVSQLLG